MAVERDIVWRGIKWEIDGGDGLLRGILNVTGAVTLDSSLAVTGAVALSSTLAMAGITNTGGLVAGAQVEIGSSGAGLGTIANDVAFAYYNFADGTSFLPLAPVDNQVVFAKNINGTGTWTLSGDVDGATELTLVTLDAALVAWDASGTTWRTLSTYVA